MLLSTATCGFLSPGSSRIGTTWRGALTEKLAHPLCDEATKVFQREVTGINQVQLCFWDISLVGLGPFDGEEWIVLSPEYQHSWLSTPEVLMPAIIERDIRLIIVKQIELNCGIARTIQKKLIHRIRIRADPGWVGDTVCVLEESHIFREEIAYGLLGLGIAMRPERLHRIERAADTFLVSISVLNDNALNRIRMF